MKTTVDRKHYAIFYLFMLLTVMAVSFGGCWAVSLVLSPIFVDLFCRAGTFPDAGDIESYVIIASFFLMSMISLLVIKFLVSIFIDADEYEKWRGEVSFSQNDVGVLKVIRNLVSWSFKPKS